ncbi:hypothetical protein OIU34_20140 [Pararhizobium sp. BT-229]|uniref:hypothetical protein n=1 Tax=Pararhizobium sp. BT-229 TaxID=2986923 RepID=UPI0021F77572|nr:hypothetical protein [Pararhizobium sp. BT-229]MCV9964198.1 hypothetical protein [Pararhizobium sp. BT-229]
MSPVATADIGDIASGRERQRLRTSLILAHIGIEVRAQDLRFAQYIGKDDWTRKNRRRVKAAQELLAEAEARKKDVEAALVADLKKHGTKPA